MGKNPHEELLERYVAALREARDVALAWWDSLLRAAGPDPAAAEAAVRLRWPAGPTSHPRVLHVFRTFFLACEALNDGLEQAQAAASAGRGWGEDDEEVPGPIPPARLLLDGLEAHDPELSVFMESLVYLPIGTDLEGDTA